MNNDHRTEDDHVAPETVMFDFVVVGTGVGGLTAAITAHQEGMRTLVVEKADTYGGTTAFSGGVVWIPNNSVMRKAGIHDSREDALDYWKHTVGDDVPDERRDAFLDHGPAVIDYLLRHSPLELEVSRPSDYCVEFPGGTEVGRSLEAKPARRGDFGDLLAGLRPPYFEVPGGAMVSIPQAGRLTLAATSVRHAGYTAGVIASHLLRKAVRPDSVHVTTGQALIAYLRKGLQQRGVEVWLNAAAESLVTSEGRITGLVVRRNGIEHRIVARHGVLLTAGGFAHDPARRNAEQPATSGGRWSAAPAEDTGDAVRMSLPVGAATELMDESWWMPITLVPGESKPYLVLFERFKPGFVMVDGSGRRFVNEAAPYHIVGRAMIDRNSQRTPSIPSWFIMDRRYLRLYSFGPVMPLFPRKRFLRNSFLEKANSIAELADAIGVDRAALVDTVSRHNHFAVTGRDEDFGRGDNVFDRTYADPACSPNPCLAPIAHPPFYAAKVYPGDIGTKGGLVTDAHGRVLDTEGAPIAGLYASGNSSASVMGRHYPGAGATLAPSMVFAHLAALHAVQEG